MERGGIDKNCKLERLHGYACVRLLIKGDSGSSSGSRIWLGFKGRDFGDYTISKVSIARKDSGEGNIVDSTRTEVTFAGNRPWTDVITIPEEIGMTSDPVSFSFERGRDYYVTFEIESPSVCLNAPDGCGELYFDTDDYTDDLDWSGYTVGNTLHALSIIFVAQ